MMATRVQGMIAGLQLQQATKSGRHRSVERFQHAGTRKEDVTDRRSFSDGG
jgi:hypothetical protein